MYHYTDLESPIGRLTLASDGVHLTGLWLKGQRFFAAGHSGPVFSPEKPVFLQAAQWLADYFAGRRPDPGALPLLPQGTPFQQLVWQQLLTVPYGETVTYGQLAALLGRPQGAQAVGGAVGRNPISVIIPCHRVIGTDGNLTSYAGGTDRKLWLLTHEQCSSPPEKAAK